MNCIGAADINVKCFNITGIATQPQTTIQQPGFTATLTAVTTETKATIGSVVWHDGNHANDWTDPNVASVSGSKSGYKVYTSKLVVTPTPMVANKTYTCMFNVTGGPPVISHKAMVYRGGELFTTTKYI